ncbi:MAG: helix-turn-helix domain-containing protein [Clostridia bacterium]|nr:helix-turn-helix domain-containing protein [Clostridia bacterium]
MVLAECNPFLRAAQFQPAVLEGEGLRIAYDYRIFYVLENSGTLILENMEHPLSPDTLILIPPGVGYYFRGRLKVAVLNFDMTRACTSRKKPICPPPKELYRQELAFDKALPEDWDAPFLFSGDLQFRQWISDIVSRNENDGWSSGALKQLLAEIAWRRENVANPEQQLANEIGAYIRLHAADLTDNAELGEIFGYHPVYLGKIFKTHTGKTLHGALTEARLALACRWLTQTDRSIEQIAFDTGFSSRSHFCTVFRKAFGISPGIWRKER